VPARRRPYVKHCDIHGDLEQRFEEWPTGGHDAELLIHPEPVDEAPFFDASAASELST
jgi:hypothetical protein